jgi:RsiW-degrading membrane proteinase PrsW (M82 family)
LIGSGDSIFTSLLHVPLCGRVLFSFRKPQNSSHERVWPLIVVIWWLAIFILINLSYGMMRANDLAKHVTTTEATITGFRPDYHNSVVISFTVAGTTYTTLSNGVNDSSRATRKVNIYYDLRDPRNLSLIDPVASAKQIETDVFWIITLSIMATSFLLVYSFARSRSTNLPPIFR